ncbi:hypothetical protein ACEWPM_018950 [Roseovarius sp. S4756]|uniref:hypothetical protein n=1 Tax=Roseovarius maritimus TaxID=3342637 RepID=UPI0037283C35
MSTTSKPQRRWMTSALKTAAGDMPALPFQRGQRKSFSQRTGLFRLRPRTLRSA